MKIKHQHLTVTSRFA